MKIHERLLMMFAFVVLAAFAVATGWLTTPVGARGDDAARGNENSNEARSQGTLLWQDRYNPTSFEQAFMIAADKGRAFAAGYVLNRNGRDAVVRAYEAKTGRLLWQDNVNRGNDEFASGVVTDGRLVYVSGAAVLPNHDFDWTLRAYDAQTGALVWDTTWDLAGGIDIPRGTALAISNGRILLGGYGTTGAGHQDWIVRAYNASDGALIWQDQRDLSGGSDGVYSLAADNNRVFAGGWGDEGSIGHAVLRVLDARDGALLWEESNRTGGQGLSYVRRVKVDGGRVFAGILLQDLGSGELTSVIAAYRAVNGTRLWEGALDASPRHIIEDLHASDGYVVATGQGGAACVDDFSPPSDCAAVVRVFDAARGSVRWSSDLQLSVLDDEAAMVTAEGGKIFVLTQQAATHNLPGCCVIGRWVMHAFDAMSGTLLWRSVGGPLESGVYNTVIDEGILFAPGRAVDKTTNNWDFIVRAYDTRGSEGTIEPLPFVPLPELVRTGTAGQASFEVSSPEIVAAVPFGLVPATAQPANVVDDPANDFSTALSTGVGVTVHKITVPVGTKHLRISLFNDETDGADDLDLFAITPGGRFLVSAGGTSAERIDVVSPTPGDYIVLVHGYETQGPDANYTLFSWVLPPTASGNFTVSGPPPGGIGTVTVNWSGLTAGVRYFGDISFVGAGSEVGHTFVSFGPEPQPPLAISRLSGQQSGRVNDRRNKKSNDGIRAFDDCAVTKCGLQRFLLLLGDAQLDHSELIH